MAKTKEKNTKKAWDFSGFDNSDDLSTIEKQEETKISTKKEDTLIDPLALFFGENEVVEKNDVPEVPDFIHPSSTNEVQEVLAEKETVALEEPSLIQPAVEKKNPSSVSFSSMLNPAHEKKLPETETVNQSKQVNDRKIDVHIFEEDFTVAKLIKNSNEDKGSIKEENQTEVKEVSSASLAKERLAMDLKRANDGGDISHLLPVVIKKEAQKKDLFSPWVSVDEEDKKKAYIGTIAIMLSLIGISSSILF